MRKTLIGFLLAGVFGLFVVAPAMASEEWCMDDPVIFGHHVIIPAPKSIQPWLETVVIGW